MSGEAAGEETLEAVVADLHTGGLVLYGRLQQGISEPVFYGDLVYKFRKKL